MSCEKGNAERRVAPVAVIPSTIAEKEPVRYFDYVDTGFGGGEPYQAAIEKRAAEIMANPRFSI